MAGEYKSPFGAYPLPALRPSSKLNEEKARKKFQEFWTRPYQCPICGSLEWQFGTHLVQLAHYTDVSSGEPFLTYPCVVVICKRCGHILLFNAKVLDLDNV